MNLPEGDYTFEVKNIYPDGKDGKVTSLQIHILPHWSRTLPFRLFILLLLAGGVAYLIRLVKHRQMRMEREMRMEHELLSVNLERENFPKTPAVGAMCLKIRDTIWDTSESGIWMHHTSPM